MRVTKFKMDPNGATVTVTSDKGHFYTFAISKTETEPPESVQMFEVGRTYNLRRIENYFIAPRKIHSSMRYPSTEIADTGFYILNLAGATKEPWFKEILERLLFGRDLP